MLEMGAHPVLAAAIQDEGRGFRAGFEGMTRYDVGGCSRQFSKRNGAAVFVTPKNLCTCN